MESVKKCCQNSYQKTHATKIAELERNWKTEKNLF